MAKSNFMAMMKAKPNARGKRSHLPLLCGVQNCEEDFIVSYSNEYPPKRYCIEHATVFNPTTDGSKAQMDQVLKQLGVIA